MLTLAAEHVGDAVVDPVPHLPEQVAAFNGELALRVRLVSAQGTLLDADFEVIQFKQVVLPGLVVNA